MRREWRWAMAAAIALVVGSTCAKPYARLMVPYYGWAASLIAQAYPWKIDEVVLTEDAKSPGSVVRMTGEVFQQRGDAQSAGTVVARVQVGEIVETPIVFWTLLLVWPAATLRQRCAYLAAGLPVFLALEVVTTVCQLVHSMATGSAIIGGDNDPLTVWERWSRFLEAGGTFVLGLAGATLTVTATAYLRPKRVRAEPSLSPG